MDIDQNPIKLKLNQSFSTSNPTIMLRGLLHAGEYQFQLEVIDTNGACSRATTVTIIVNPPQTFWHKLQSWLVPKFRTF